MSTFTERIDLELKKKMLKRLALCDYVNIDSTSIAVWKKRGTIPAGDICFRIADYLCVDCRWLVLGEESENVTLTPEQKKLLAAWEELSQADREEIEMLIDFKNKAAKAKALPADSVG